jgi:ABC-2 type transport system ATP-binding protein
VSQGSGTGLGADLGSAVSCHRLERSFGDVVAVQPMTLSLEPGALTGIIGPNGSGKSTFLRMLLGLVRPDGGEATVAGIPLAGDGLAIRRRTSYAPGEIGLYGELRVGAHLDWLMRGRERGAAGRARAIAAELGLPLRARVRALSHGMKRQLLVAAALAPDVRLRILDEPTEGLDPSMRRRVLGLLADEVERGTTILLSSHHLGEVDEACTRLVFFHEGRLLADEAAAGLHARGARLLRLGFAPGTDTERVAEALRGPGVVRVTARSGRVVVDLESPDPRPLLASLPDRAGVPAPTLVEFGHLDLRELYADLYGVEGI